MKVQLMTPAQWQQKLQNARTVAVDDLHGVASLKDRIRRLFTRDLDRIAAVIAGNMDEIGMGPGRTWFCRCRMCS